MRLRLFLGMALMGLALSSCSKYDYEEVKGDLTQTRIYTLKNGLKVYLSVNKEEPRIQTYIAVRTGSKNDPAETTGLAHYLEHLMFKGTSQFGTTDAAKEAPLLDEIEQRYEKYRKMTDPEERRQAYHEIDSVSQLAAKYNIPNEYDKLMATIGSEGSNAYTSEDVTCYVENIPSNEIDNWAKIQADRFMNMTIRGFHTELEAVYEEYNIYLTDDTDKLFSAMQKALYPTHPYGTQTTIGTQEHLKNPSITNIKNYFKKWYVPNNVAICMAGDFDPDEVIATIYKYFGQWQPGEDVKQPEFPVQQQLTHHVDTTVVGQEAETLWMGYAFDKASSLQIDTLQVVERMLSNGTAGLIDLDINQKMLMLGAGTGVQSGMDYTTLILAGTPMEGQSLEEVRTLLLAEIEKLKKGEFSDDLLPSVVNNMKLQYYNALESNQARANMYVQSFIHGTEWKQEVESLERVEGMTKAQIVAFANEHFKDNYVAVFKKQGVDPNQKKIEKPAITPIPTNRDYVSQFVKDIQAAKVTPIAPRFVDFKKDLTFGQTEKNLPYIYVNNNENGRFQMSFYYPFGSEADVRYGYAGDYLDYLGTDSLTAQEVKQQFYKLACNYNIQEGDRSITVSLNGLSENMTEALALLEHLMKNAKVDNEAYAQFVAMEAKSRMDNKLDQRTNFNFLTRYAQYGAYNPSRHDMSIAELQQTNPQELLDLLKNLSTFEHTLLYYGPMSEKELAEAVTSTHQTPETLKTAPEDHHYVLQATPESTVTLAPYDAKNIYMMMYHNENRGWKAEEAPVTALFNEYFGSGMNTIVFQELREARGLAYSASAYYVEPTYEEMPEYFYTYIITQNDKMMDCVNQFHTILNEMPQSESAFNIAKESLTKKLASQRTTKFGLINAWLVAQRRGIDYDINQRIYEALPNLTMADVLRFANEQVANKAYNYIILGDEAELDMASLEKLGSIKRLTTEEIFGY